MSAIGRLDRIAAALLGPKDEDIARQRAEFAYLYLAQINSCVRAEGKPLEFLRNAPHEGQHKPIAEVSTEYAGKIGRHTPMNLHPKQIAYWKSGARFTFEPCGRRSGKTELIKRKRVKTALRYPIGTKGKVIFGAPVYNQAVRIYWDDIKEMLHPRLIRSTSESDKTIKLYNGVDIVVTGMDEPRRVEGDPLLGIVLDEYGDMKPTTWDAHVRPALTDTQGWADRIGCPEGRNFYYDDVCAARGDPECEIHHWTTEEVLPYYLGAEAAEREIASAKRRMDPLTYDQEYRAAFISFEGRAYYQFAEDDHCKKGLKYDPEATLVFCFDFNVAPGVAVVLQEANGKTRVIGEVYIPRNSNTPMVCRKLVEKWGHHLGFVHVYGDATGGAGGTAKTEGSDWELVKKVLTPAFGNRLRMRVDRSNPRERARVNAVNSRLKSTDGFIGTEIDGQHCPYLIKDLEGVTLVEGGSGEIDKHADPKLTHISDAFGYYVAKQFPVKGADAFSVDHF